MTPSLHELRRMTTHTKKVSYRKPRHKCSKCGKRRVLVDFQCCSHCNPCQRPR
jgi:hypothetical protein